MKLNLGDTSSPSLNLDFGTGDAPRLIALRDIDALAGALAITPSAVVIDGARLTSLILAGVRWSLPGGQLTVDNPLTASDLSADLRITKTAARAPGQPPLAGSIRIGQLAGASLQIGAGAQRATASVAATGLSYHTDDDAVGHASVDSINMRDLQTSLGGLLVRASTVAIGTASAQIDGRDLRITMPTVAINQLALHGGGLEVTLSDIVIENLTYDRGSLSVQAIRAGRLEVALDPLLRARPPGETGQPRSAPPIDLRVLDLLNGQVDVDLAVDVTVPVLGRRKATHHFRIGVESGTIDFKELEGGLAGLEDAFIDFEVEGDTLVLERDIPLIPGDNKPIVIWRLEETAEVELAQRKRVRLRRLPKFELAQPKKPAKEQKDGPVGLRSLALDNIDVSLSMSPEQAAVSLDAASQQLEGWLQRAALGELRVTGAVYHEPAAEPAASTLSIAGRALEIALAGVPAGKASIRKVALTIATIESLGVQFAGLRPQTLAAAVSELALLDLEIEL